MRLFAVPSLILLASSAFAQGLLPAFVSDTAGDTIWACTDLDQDGDYDGALEVAAFYDDTVGPVALTNNAGMKAGPDGRLYVTDTSEDFVLVLSDIDGDGDAHDAGEAVVWFDGTAGNPSGIELTSGRGLHIDEDGVVWVASANTGGGGDDAIVRLEDTNADGDANDAGEQLEYYLPAFGSGTAGDSIPASITRGPDGALYYVETGSTGFFAKGVYRLEDLDGSGTIDQPNESAPFFLPTSTSGNSFFWDISVDADGQFLIDDTGDDVIRRFADTSGDGTITEGVESTIFWTASGSSLVWNVSQGSDGAYYVTEDQNPDRLLRFVDANSNGLIEDAEVSTVYDETTAAVNLGSPKAIVVPSLRDLGTSYCGPAVPNSAGLDAQIQLRGTGVAGAPLEAVVIQGPPGEFGYCIASRDQGFVNPPGSSGFLCLANNIGRYNDPVFIYQFDGAGVSQAIQGGGPVVLPTNPIPVNPPTPAMAGETWNFQGWYRDGMTSNFSDGRTLTFQ
ncbi:MAG: hypothetical protein GY711_16375 [bacterium]|nr:hypothetical protein [bacterium]